MLLLIGSCDCLGLISISDRMGCKVLMFQPIYHVSVIPTDGNDLVALSVEQR